MYPSIMARLLEYDPPIAAKNTALLFAAKWGETETAASLLSHGADLHSWENGIIRQAIEGGHQETIAWLVGAAAAKTEEPFCTFYTIYKKQAEALANLPTNQRYADLFLDLEGEQLLKQLAGSGLLEEVFNPIHWIGSEINASVLYEKTLETLPSFYHAKVNTAFRAGIEELMETSRDQRRKKLLDAEGEATPLLKFLTGTELLQELFEPGQWRENKVLVLTLYSDIRKGLPPAYQAKIDMIDMTAFIHDLEQAPNFATKVKTRSIHLGAKR